MTRGVVGRERVLWFPCRLYLLYVHVHGAGRGTWA